MLDHVIVGGDHMVSLAERGQLQPRGCNLDQPALAFAASG